MNAYRVEYSSEALAHLRELYRYISSEASPAVALRFTSTIRARCEKLASFPHQGSPRDDLRAGIRTVVFKRRTTIAYMVESEIVTVIGIFHGGRDQETLLRGDAS